MIKFKNMRKNEVNEAIEAYLNNLKNVLKLKNNAYNNSLHEPNQVFFKGDTITGICARIDDKLNRIKKAGLSSDTEDSVEDLIGYLVHLKIAMKQNV